MIKILSILILALLGLPAFAQTWNQATSLTNLLSGAPVVGGLYVVHGERTPRDWGDSRLARHVPNSTATTNLGNVFAFGNGRLIFYDATNTVQDARWWRVRLDGTTDNRVNLQALADYMPTIGGGVILSGSGTNAISDMVTFSSGTILRGVDVNTSKVRDLGGMTNARPLLYWAGSAGTPVSLAITNPPGTNIVYLSSSISGLTNGSRIRISDTNLWSYSGYRSYYHAGEDAIVASVDGTTVYTVGAINGIYTNGLAKVWPITDVYGGLENITVQTSSNPVPVRVVYGRDFRIKHARIQGSAYENVALDGCFNASVYDSGGNTFREHGGNDYWAVVGGSQNVDLNLVSAISPGHPISIGSARALPGGATFIPIVNRFVSVSHSFANSYASRFASIDAHGNSEYVQVGPGNSIQRGVSLGGNHHRVFGNINIGNPEAQPAVNLNEQTGSDFQVTENKFSLVIGNTNVVWGVASQFSTAGLNGSATNWWAGDGITFSRDSLQVSRNTFSIVNGPLSSGSDLIFLGESTGMNTNASRAANFGPWIVSENTVDDKETPASDSSSIAIDVQPSFLVRPSSVTIERNHLGPYTIFVRSTALNNRITDNIITGAVGNSGYGGIFYDDAAYRLDSQSHTISRNFVIGAANLNSIHVTDVAGFLDVSENTVDGWNTLRNGVNIDSPNVRAFTGIGNRFRNTVTTTNLEAFSVSVTNAFARISGNQLQTSNLTFGAISTGSDLTQWRDDSTYVELTGRGLKVPFMPELSVRGTNWVDTLTATNTVQGSNFIGISASIGTGTLLATPGKSPIHIYGNTNELARIILENASTGTGAGAGLQGTADGVIGRLMALGTNNTTAARKARFAMDATKGAGLNIDLPFPTSQDIVFSYGGGTPFATITTNKWSIRAPATASAPTHFLTFLASPDGTHRATYGSTADQVLSGIGAQPIDADLTRLASVSWSLGDFAYRDATGLTNFASTAAGRALLNAVDAAAQRTSLGLGGLAVLNDAASDGNEYVRKNGAWSVASGGGGGGIAGVRVSGTLGSTIDGVTNLAFSVAPGTALGITTSGTSPNSTIDYENLFPGFLVNGTGQTYETERWNLNSTTPAALTETVLAIPSVSTTNLSITVPIAPTILLVTPTVLSNSASYATIASGWLSSTNLPYVGAALQGTIIGTFYNNTASGAANFFRTVVGGVTNLHSDPGGFGITSSSVTRSFVVEVLITRNSGVVNTAIGYQVGGSTAPTAGYSVLSSTPGLAPRWTVGTPASCNVATNVFFKLDVANNMTSTNFTTSIFGGGFK